MSEDIKLIIKNGKTRLENGAAASHHHHDHHHDHGKAEAVPANFIPLSAVARHNASEVRASEDKTRLDLEAVRKKLAHGQGMQYWRSLEELAGREDFHELLEREFPQGAPRDMSPLTRREFVRLMGASLALAGLAGCAFQPAEKILPYTEQPENVIPGKPLFYATAMTLGGYGIGVLAESHLGRPIKLEGNPLHPACHGRAGTQGPGGSTVQQGASNSWVQASILGLYDPERSQNVRRRGELSSWGAFSAELYPALKRQKDKRGAGLRILTETVTSPTLAGQIADLLRVFPEAKWHQYEPLTRDNVREGARLAFGEVVHTIYDFSKADIVVSLDSNFLEEEPGHIAYASDFVNKRRGEAISAHKDMSRFFAVESMPTITGAMADNRLPMRASDVEAFARALGAAVEVPGLGGEAPQAGAGKYDAKNWVEIIAKELQGAHGKSIVIAGDHQPPIVHAIAHAINDKLGNAGNTVLYTAPVEANPVNQTMSLKNLVADMKASKATMLLILGGNPVYTAPADLGFAKALQAMSQNPGKLTVHLGLYFDETAAYTQWHVPEAHYLEAWGDTRAYDGTVAIQQPLIVPLYGDAKSPLEMVAALLVPSRSAATQALPSAYELVRGYWAGKRGGGSFDKFWNKCIHDGVVPETRQLIKTFGLRANFAGPASQAAGQMEISFRRDPSVWDGRFANNAWLQELPRPLTKLVWDNAAHISLATAQKLGVREGDKVTLQTGVGKADFPVWIMPGHPDNSVTVHLGYGRTQAGKVAAGVDGSGGGFDAYPLRAVGAMDVTSVEVKRSSGWVQLVSTQQHHLIDRSLHQKPGMMDTLAGREHDILRSETLEEYKAGRFPAHKEHEGGSMYPPMWPSDIATQDQWQHHESGKVEAHGAAGHGAPGEGAGKHSEHGAGGKAAGGEAALPQHPFNKDGVDVAHQHEEDQVVPQGFEKKSNYAQHQWGMSIDLNTCIGCNACVMACNAENNVATVGKAMVGMNREMHWLRIDTYYKGPVENPVPYFQPMLCQHCEKAPCEPVCPVEATSHSAEGINEMTYNRCIGTKYCSNNCPYKVRRFNFLQWSDLDTPTINLMRNPDVTVRSRGVMEKCTFCVQRVNAARIQAEREGRPVRDGEVLTACQQACPTNTIVFGNLVGNANEDKNKPSRVRELRDHLFSYSVLAELSTYPRVTYLAQVRNPHPALESPEGTAPHMPTREGSVG